MPRFFTILFLLLAGRTLVGQSLSGLVVDATRQPAAFAVVKLLKATDSTLVKGTVTSEIGQYSFTDIADGYYYVQASGVGVASTLSSVVAVRVGPPVKVSSLRLETVDQVLTSVVVRAKRALVEQQVDKTVLNVAADATAQGKTAYELLQQAPGVVIDPNDNIRMAGKQGVIVFIDGKPTNLSATDLANLLRATPASGIDQVELITNPSARFDAQGGAGIINIRFRRDKSLGLNGNASAGYGQSDHHRANAAVDLNYRAKRLSLFGNVAVSDNFQLTNVRLDRQTNGSQFLQRGYDSDGTRAIVYKAGADFIIDSHRAVPRQTIGLVVSGNASGNRFGTFTTTQLVNRQNTLDSSVVNQATNGTRHQPARNNRTNAALNYRYADTLGRELNLDADLTYFHNTSPNLITSDYYNADGQSLFRRQRRFDASTNITIGTLKGDFVKEWKERHLKLETGLKHTNVSTDNDLLAFVGAEPEQPDESRTNRFTYREIVNAAYASLSRTAGKWSMQGGLRVEHARVNGQSTDLRQQTILRPDTAYLNLFPTAFVQYRATDNSQFGINYGRRIGRPSYQDMNPFIYQIDPYTSQRGNPYLRPTYTHTLEASYIYKWASTVKLAYSQTSDFATDVIRQEGLTAYQTVANVGQVDALNLSVSTPYQFTKWWSTYAYAGATWNRFRGSLSPSEPFDQRTFAFEGYMQHSFTLSKIWSAQASGFWSAPTRQTIYRIGGLGALNLSVQKKVMQDRGKLTLGMDDVLNTMRWRQSADFQTQQFTIDRKWESRRITIRFSYQFGSKDIKNARERETNSDAGRIKVKGNL
ncbi:outer membrane beta-barrel family protein [Spirosoma fluviale]|uniref:Outer membrane receptor proteins, mostly Fe transport n=1 Tax=Spirosoma fluviale TaxID=1597977 RepID=A0A286F7R2_9BACT|nr:outer membrane beta-barrel family protein [Spirosoma fluviale]SOD79240.1 Outer membrane receptor proteins, mostly Fe transport [Spirosoma fluviale]